jgi:hypothetical protein
VGSSFYAYNAAGERLWSYDPGPALATSMYAGHTDPSRLPLPDLTASVSTAVPLPYVSISDLDGDGRREVLLIAHAQGLHDGPTLHCLDADGGPRWTFTPRDTFAFGGKHDGPPVRLQWVTVSTDGRGRTSVWTSAEHATWYPTWVYRLDVEGKVLGRYGSNGRVAKIRFASAGGRQFALLGGVNNERGAAALAVFDVERFGGAAPAETAEYRCRNCTPGQPEQYLLFPRTEVSRVTGGLPFVAELAVQPSDEIVVSVQQHHQIMPGEVADYQALINYSLDSAFRVRGAEFYTQYAVIHDHLAAAGRLDHRFSLARDKAQLWPVLRWNGSGYDRIEGPER